MSKRTTYLVPGFHSDVVWLEDQRDYAVALLSDVDQNLQICRMDPGYGVFLHELTYLKPYIDLHPESRAEIRRLIRQKRVGTGGSHSQPTEAVVSGEGLLRNILYGRLYHEGQLGDRPRIYMPWDVFGHSAQLGQILRKSRFDGCIWSKDIRGALAVFHHLSLDGEPFLFKRMGYWFDAWEPQRFLDSVEAFYTEIEGMGLSADCRLDATDFKPPSSWFAGRCQELAEREHQIIVSGKGHEMWLDDTLNDVKSGRARIPTTARDYEWHHQGTALSRIEFKICNRLAENLLIEAEKLATFAWLLGAEYPDRALDKAWRQVLFNQHHDGITGPCCDRAYLDLMLGYREALELASEVRDRAAAALADTVDTSSLRPGGRQVVVFNSMNWARREPVTVSVEFEQATAGFEVSGPEGRVPAQLLRGERNPEGLLTSAEILLIPDQVPGLGYSTYEIAPKGHEASVERPLPGITIENEFFRVTADPTHGGLTSIYDKVTGREVLDPEKGFGNELIALEEKPDRGEPGWECYTTGPRRMGREYAAKVTAYGGPACQRLVISGEMKDCGREQIVRLYPGVPRIEFETRLIGYKGEHDLFVVAFPTSVEGAEPVFEERFGATVKRKSRGKFDYRFHQWRNYSDCGARRALQWVDLSGSAWLSFDDGRSLAIGMTNIVTAHNAAAEEACGVLQQALIRCGVPVTPSYDDCDWPRRSKLPAEDSLMPPPDDFNRDLNLGTSFRVTIMEAGDNTYAASVLGQLTPADRESVEELLSQPNGGAMLLYDHAMPSDWPALPVLLIGAPDGAALVKLCRALARDLEDGIMELPTESCGVEGPLQASDYGVALLNFGNPLNSVENDNTMVLFLMHTAAWGGTPWGKDRLDWFLVPEHKTHVFHYALFPHEGDWRSAGVTRQGYAFNNPLVAVPTEASDGPLPTVGQFLEVSGGGIVTAVKPRGNPTAGFSGQPHCREDGVIVRAYEPHGHATAAVCAAPWPLLGGRRCNLIEEPYGPALRADEGGLRLPLGGFSIESALLNLEVPEQPCAGRLLGPDREAAEIVHFRHWEHNTGAEPIGYSPIAVSISGEILTGFPIEQSGVTVNTVRVSVSNNLVDESVSGTVSLVTPPGWHTVPEEIPYELAPLSHSTHDVLLCFDTGQRDKKNRVGLLKARVEHRGTVYQDVREIGGPIDLEWWARRDGDRVGVMLTNPTPDTIEGQVFLAIPMELFGRAAGPFGLGHIGPREHSFSIAPGETLGLWFQGDEGYAHGRRVNWVVAKVAYNGRVFYRPV